MIATKSEEWRRGKLIALATAFFSIIPTYIYSSTQYFVCVITPIYQSQAQYDTSPTPSPPIQQGDISYSKNPVNQHCDSLFIGICPLLVCCAYFVFGQIVTTRNSTLTIARMASLEMTYLEILEGSFSLVLMLYAIVAFGLKKTDVDATTGLFYYCAFIFGLCCVIFLSFFRDRKDFLQQDLLRRSTKESFQVTGAEYIVTREASDVASLSIPPAAGTIIGVDWKRHVSKRASSRISSASIRESGSSSNVSRSTAVSLDSSFSEHDDEEEDDEEKEEIDFGLNPGFL